MNVPRVREVTCSSRVARLCKIDSSLDELFYLIFTSSSSRQLGAKTVQNTLARIDIGGEAEIEDRLASVADRSRNHDGPFNTKTIVQVCE